MKEDCVGCGWEFKLWLKLRPLPKLEDYYYYFFFQKQKPQSPMNVGGTLGSPQQELDVWLDLKTTAAMEFLSGCFPRAATGELGVWLGFWGGMQSLKGATALLGVLS